MSNNLHNELRKEFQLERLILFSDAVFAIAITLLVIEIKIPEIHSNELSEKKLLTALFHLIPKFIGFLISFLIIGQYWTVHHRMFGYVINFNNKVLWLNILFLLCIALMPFSTGFYSEYAGMPVITPVIFYTGNICLLGITCFFLWRYLGNPNHGLTENLSPQLARYSALRAITVPFIFIVCTLAYLWKPVVAAFIPLTIPLILRLVFGPMKKKIIENSK
ncbi:MAG: TMEM175 family protein [Bacteroidota bacterium]